MKKIYQSGKKKKKEEQRGVGESVEKQSMGYPC